MPRHPQETPRDSLDLMGDGSQFRLPISLNEFMAGELCSKPTDPYSVGNKDSVSLIALRSYIEDLNFDDVDSTISKMLNSLTSLPAPIESEEGATSTRSGVSTEACARRLDVSHWSEPFSGNNFAEDLSLLSLRSSGGSPCDALPGHKTVHTVSPFMFTTYYDSPQRLNVDDLSVSTPHLSESFRWDSVWNNPSLKRYVRPSVTKVKPMSCSFLSESLQAIKEEVMKAEKALACVLDHSSYFPRAEHVGEGSSNTGTAKSDRVTNSVSKAPTIYHRTSLCRYWQRGVCKKSDCNFAHGTKELVSTLGVWKTTICHHWKNGTCRVGSDCRHAHGEAERQPRLDPENASDPRPMSMLLKQERASNSRSEGGTVAGERSQPTGASGNQRTRHYRRYKRMNNQFGGS